MKKCKALKLCNGLSSIRCRQSILLACLLLISTSLMARQGDPVPEKPAPYLGSMNVSYIRTWDALAPETDPNAIMTRPLKDVHQTTQYFDGLGRLLQTVMKQGSLQTGSSPVDLVAPVVYDEFGRETRQYLPFASPENNGGFKLDPFDQQATFYLEPNGVLKGQNETYFYSKSDFEGSPLNRVQETFAPGNSWVGTSPQINENDRHSVKRKYFVNTEIDEVKIWRVENIPGSWAEYELTGEYAEGELYKNVMVDEEGKQLIEFKDKDGLIILKKVQMAASADDGTGRGHSGWFCTYYIYDEQKNLRCAVQPLGVELLALHNCEIAPI